MMDDKLFRDLFDEALAIHRKEFYVDDQSIQEAIKIMQTEYSPRPWKDCSKSNLVNYNHPAYRCAYLHKYASCHAGLVRYVLLQMLSTEPLMFRNSFMGCDPISICCLGGGPGTDVVGLSSVFSTMDEFQNTSFRFAIVDCMIQWLYALSSVLTASKSFRFGSLSSFMSSCGYLEADMLSYVPEPVIETIRSSEMVTMVKFVSAAASQITSKMLKIVFTLLKPGALVLFIDNAAGGFYEMVSREAFACGLSTECGPFRHLKFGNQVFKRQMFGYPSLSSTTVTAQMWRKNYTVIWNSRENHLAASKSGSSTKKHKRNRRRSSSLLKEELARETSENLIASQNQRQYLNSTKKDSPTILPFGNAQCPSSSKLPSQGDYDRVSEKQSNLKSGSVKSFGSAPVSLLQPSYTGSTSTQILREKAAGSLPIESRRKGHLVEDTREASHDETKNSGLKSDTTEKILRSTASSLPSTTAQASSPVRYTPPRNSVVQSLNTGDLLSKIQRSSREKTKHSNLKSGSKEDLQCSPPSSVYAKQTPIVAEPVSVSEDRKASVVEIRTSSYSSTIHDEESCCSSCVIC